MNNNDNLELPMLVVASVFTLEFLEGWGGLTLTIVLIIVALVRLIQWLRGWNHAKTKRKEEEAKRAEEHEQHLQSIKKRKEEEAKRAEEHKEHELRMKLLQKELEEKTKSP